MVTTGEIIEKKFIFRIENMRQNSVEVDIAAWKYVNLET